MPDADVSSTLSELERKLRELEDELQTPRPAARADAALSPAPAPGSSRSPAASAQEQLEELMQFRGELERSAQQLMSEYERVLASLGSTVPAPDAVETPEQAPAPWQPPPAASAGGLEEAVMDGAITVDAGPFTDITSLSGFEQALGGVPGVRDVYVRGFEGSRAIIDVTLGQPVALGTELHRVSPVSFSIIAADAGRLSVTIRGA